jgi:hypothetical protein
MTSRSAAGGVLAVPNIVLGTNFGVTIVLSVMSSEAVISCITLEGHRSAMARDRDRAGANAAQLAAIVLNLSVAS